MAGCVGTESKTDVPGVSGGGGRAVCDRATGEEVVV